ncbi:DNA-binding protein [Halopelagius fulvigenes]|uniref:DNA-binding protein n=1 Tax=Halopelagius fulvigenes TaxID=1198324 RepID=A0ABD5TVL1_9EURY
MTETTNAATDAPEEPTGTDEFACRTCGRTFPTDRLRILHRGVRHPADVTEAERESYREAYLEEEAEIRSFRIRALGVLVLLYFGFLIVYALIA